MHCWICKDDDTENEKLQVEPLMQESPWNTWQRKCNIQKKFTNQRSISGEEHWTKVLQANEINSASTLKSSTRRTQHANHCCRGCQIAAQQASCSKNKSFFDRVTSFSSSPKDKNIFSILCGKFCQWISAGKTDKSPHSQSQYHSCLHNDNSQDMLHLLSSTNDDIFQQDMWIQASVSSEDSVGDTNNVFTRNISSNCSSMTVISSFTLRKNNLIDTQSTTCATYSNELLTNKINENTRSCELIHYKCHCDKNTGSKCSLPLTLNCPLNHETGSHKTNSVKNNLCASWPLTQSSAHCTDISQDFKNISHITSDLQIQTSSEHMRASIVEFSIPFSDIELQTCVREGRRRKIYKGKWYGDVIVHTYSDVSDKEMESFFVLIKKLSMIRHENIALFMGASFESPIVAVITSLHTGPSLYDQIHLNREKITTLGKINIIRQISLGVGYLHARGIVICKLNSRNIHLDHKVKISLLDYGMSEYKFDRKHYGSVPRGHLTYLAPEILKTLRVKSPKLISHSPYTAQTDVYALGTVIFEIMVGHFPYRGLQSEIIIYQSVLGNKKPLQELNCYGNLKNLITQCWSSQPKNRPTLIHINKELQQNGALHRIHSSLTPEALHKFHSSNCSDIFI